jgi:signal peptidase I
VERGLDVTESTTILAETSEGQRQPKRAHAVGRRRRRRHRHRRPHRHRASKVLSWIALVLAVVLFVAMVIPSLLGYKRYVIVSGSMEPTIPVGSVVYDEVVPVEVLEVGDIITFVPPAEYGLDDPVTHRIAAITTTPDGLREFRTKGDANETIDPWAFYLDGPDQARVVRHVEYVGYFYIFLSQRWVQLFLIAIPASVIFVYLLVALWRLAGDAVVEERQEHGAGGTPA